MHDILRRRPSPGVFAVALGIAVLPSISQESHSMALCRLAPERCSLVHQEMRRLEVQKLRDFQVLTGLRPYQHELAVIERNSERVKQRLAVLPADVSGELARLLVCDSKDRLAGAQGRLNNDANCQ